MKKATTPRHSASARVPAKAVAANEKGNADFDAGRYDEAIAAYDQAIGLAPGYAEAYCNLGDAQSSLQHYEDAVKAYKQAIKFNPKYDDAYTGLSDAYNGLGMKAEADEAYGHATRNAVSGGTLNGKAVSLPRPEYPPLARRAHVSGSVIVQVLIDESGQVIHAQAMSGHPLLQPACVKAASEARFAPTQLSGQRVKVNGVIQYNFSQ